MEGSDDTCVDVVLMGRVASRDETAVSQLYDRHSRLLFGVILRIVRDRAEAEEVLQEVFVQLWSRAATYSAELGAPVAWMVRIARNRAIDRLRATTVRLRAALDAAPDGWLDDDTPESSASASERARAVKRALDALPPEQRLLIEQAYFLGLTQSELAERHGLPLGTVKTRMRTGLQTLRQQIGPAYATS